MRPYLAQTLLSLARLYQQHHRPAEVQNAQAEAATLLEQLTS